MFVGRFNAEARRQSRFAAHVHTIVSTERSVYSHVSQHSRACGYESVASTPFKPEAAA